MQSSRSSGTGYAPDGEAAADGAPIDGPARAHLLEVARAGLLCNEARLHREDGHGGSSATPRKARCSRSP